MKVLSLRPYLGEIWLAESLKELAALYKKQTGNKYPYTDDPTGGRFVKLERGHENETVWLVFAATSYALAHEFSHVLLHTFRLIGHDPREGDGEPFCYMLSQLLLDAKELQCSNS